MAMGLTQTVEEMSTRNISWGGGGGKGGRSLKSGSLNLLEPSGPVEACNGIALPLPPQWTVISINNLNHLVFTAERLHALVRKCDSAADSYSGSSWFEFVPKGSTLTDDFVFPRLFGQVESRFQA
jgi:hypothetical protein